MRKLPPSRPLRIAFVGWGAIARRTSALLAARAANVELHGVGTRKRPLGEDRLPDAVRWLSSPEDLREIEIDLLVEAAGREAVAPWGQAALERAIDFAVCSTSAFCDELLLQQLIASAESGGCKLLIPPGALAGVDALAAAAILPLESVNHRIIKPPQAWKGTIAEDLVALDELSVPATFFEGTAREAARRFPANANVAAITALAGIGLDRTQVSLVADPGAQGNRHHLAIRGDFGCLEVLIENRPLATNPKSSELTALALVRMIENQSKALAL